MPTGLDQLEHIAVLMMENRSFDHMLGSLTAADARIDGITDADSGYSSWQIRAGSPQARGDLGSSHLKHSFADGLTLRVGGFPMISMMFAWGGPEGHHNNFNMNSSLLGGSSRPSL